MKLLCLTLTNGDSALFINRKVVYSLRANDYGATPMSLGERIATSCGMKITAITIAAPRGDRWMWEDLLPNEAPDTSPTEVPNETNMAHKAVQQHTPGPWKFRPRVSDGKLVAMLLETCMRPVPLNDPVIFAIREDWMATLEKFNAANANLIVASPNLYSAARKALALIKDTWIEDHGQRQVGEAWGSLADALDIADGRMSLNEAPTFYDPETILSREKVVELLAEHDEICEPSRIGYYPSVEELAERVRGTHNWTMGEVFVFPQSPGKYIIMKQVAPSSCEMLTISQNGYHDVLTAYRFDKDMLISLLEGYMTTTNATPALAS